MALDNNQKTNKYGIWAWVGAIYGPIIFWILFINLPKVEWKYVFESIKQELLATIKKQKMMDYQESLIGEILEQEQYFI